MERVREFLGLPTGKRPTGRGVRIGVIDTGVDHTHRDLSDVVETASCKDCRRSRPGMVEDFMDYHHHGTSVAGIIAGSGAESNGRHQGIAPDATIVALRAGDSTVVDLESAIAVACNRRLDILVIPATLSPLQQPGTPPEALPPWVWSLWMGALESILDAAQRGILCIVAAGNDGLLGRGTISGLAGKDEVLAVGACDCSGQIWPESSRGPYYVEASRENVCRWFDVAENPYVEVMKPDFVAPGTDVYAPLTPNDASRRRQARKNPLSFNGAYHGFDGSSAAAAVVAGLAACALESLRGSPHGASENPSRLLRQVLRIAAGAEPRTDVESYGHGVLRWPAIEAVILGLRDQDTI